MAGGDITIPDRLPSHVRQEVRELREALAAKSERISWLVDQLRIAQAGCASRTRALRDMGVDVRDIARLT